MTATPAYPQPVQSLAIGSAAVQPQPVESAGNIWKAVSLGERVGAGILLALNLPLLLSAAAAIAILSRQSPLIAHRRVGFRGESIWVLKLRTMWDGGPCSEWRFVERLQPLNASCSVAPKAARDPRVTHVFAAFCRRFSVDELPQLWQVVRGEMALVGPRPLTPLELETHYGPDAAEILSRRPGISGLWQVSGRSRLSYRQRRRLDLFLIRKWSLPLYSRILMGTVFTVMRGSDAW